LNLELEQEIAQRKGGRPRGSVKDPDTEIIREQAAWLSRLRRSGLLIDKILAGYGLDLDTPGLSREARHEIMESMKSVIAAQVKVIVEAQRLREKKLSPPEEGGGLDLR
jgi:hypothetical protein